MAPKNNSRPQPVVPISRAQKYVPRLLRRSVRSVQAQLQQWRMVPGFQAGFRRVRPYTMLSEATLFSLAAHLESVVREQIPGNIVECGVWRGGASFLMAERLQRLGVGDRAVWMFDSFEGLPPPKEIDGKTALDYARNTDSAQYLDNCKASIEEVKAAADALGVSARVRPVKGWFNQSLPTFKREVGPIALLRIDADWYESVLCCLDELYDQVAPGGYVILDDYYTWDGCAVAVHEFLGRRKLAHRIERSECAYFRKL